MPFPGPSGKFTLLAPLYSFQAQSLSGSLPVIDVLDLQYVLDLFIVIFETVDLKLALRKRCEEAFFSWRQ